MATINGSINMFQENHVALGQVVEGDAVLLNVTVIDLTGNPNKVTLIQKMEDGTTMQITSVVINGKKVTATIPSAFCIGLVENQLIFTNGSQTTTTKFYYYVNRKIDIDDGTITPDVPQIDLSNYATTEYVDKVFNFFTVEIEDEDTSTIVKRTVAAVRQKWINIIEENKITREYDSVNYSKDIVVKVNVAGRPFSIFVTLNYTTAEQYPYCYIINKTGEIVYDRPDGEEWIDWTPIHMNIPPLDAVTKPIVYDKEAAIIPGLGVSQVTSNKYIRNALEEYARIRRFPIIDTTNLVTKGELNNYPTEEEVLNIVQNNAPSVDTSNLVTKGELNIYTTEEEVLNIVQNNAPSVDTSNLVTRNELNGYSTTDHTHDYAKIYRCTQDEYIAITNKDPNTLYIII